ncbi:hypothetical protein [Paraburkholderia bannensis]|uniref:hypothetical protein n=1 Tax=Paraburkholderia bannensis TaxID=765414 RepID=UPI002AC3371A|nr:hypothetical protein [Paraburkholderia bannensis]
MQTIRRPSGPVMELDLEGERPLVRIDGETLQGVSRATLEVEAFETPVLIVRITRFNVKGGSLPPGLVIGLHTED